MEITLLVLSGPWNNLEKFLEETDNRISATEDNYCAHDTMTTEKMVEQLKLKRNDLENHGRCKSLKIISLPEKVESNITFSDFLWTPLPILVSLPADFTLVEVEHDSYSDSRQALEKHPHAVLPERSCALALKKCNFHNCSSKLQFYPNLSGGDHAKTTWVWHHPKSTGLSSWFCLSSPALWPPWKSKLRFWHFWICCFIHGNLTVAV